MHLILAAGNRNHCITGITVSYQEPLLYSNGMATKFPAPDDHYVSTFLSVIYSYRDAPEGCCCTSPIFSYLFDDFWGQYRSLDLAIPKLINSWNIRCISHYISLAVNWRIGYKCLIRPEYRPMYSPFPNSVKRSDKVGETDALCEKTGTKN
jgi:hypothetical protein